MKLTFTFVGKTAGVKCERSTKEEKDSGSGSEQQTSV